MFLLARDLGMTVGELRRRMTHGEFQAWQGLYRVEDAERARREKRR